VARAVRQVALVLTALLAAIPAAGEPLRILFIGNSLTATNDLPATVCRLAAAAGKAAQCESLARPAHSLADHLAAGEAVRRIREGRFDLVVMQQGPSALEESRVQLRRSAAEFAGHIRAAGAKPAMYAVWPWKSRAFDFPAVARSYRLAAEDIDGHVFAVGEAWIEAWRRDPKLPLYGNDDFHPSPAGSYLAALVIHRGIWGELPESFSDPAVAKVSVTATQLRILVAVAQAGGGKPPQSEAAASRRTPSLQ
jgi:hypothetical protein